jgi:hypothetical protein
MTAHSSSAEVNQRLMVTDGEHQPLSSTTSSSSSSSSSSSPSLTVPLTTNNNGDKESLNGTASTWITPLSKENREGSVGFGAVGVDYSMFEIPNCVALPAEEVKSMETYLLNGMRAYERFTAVNNNSTTANDVAGSNQLDPSHLQGYQAMINSLKRPADPPLLRKLFITLRQSSMVLNQLALGNDHAQFVHLIIKFQSTRKPHRFEEGPNDEDAEELLEVYDDYSLCDAHFSLLLSMVSAKSTHVVPILSAVWKLLTKFGPIEDDAM